MLSRKRKDSEAESPMHRENTIETITSVVLHHVSDVTLIPPGGLKFTDRVVADLRVDGDDISFLIAPGIERDLGIVLSDAEWQQMRTIGDIIDAFTKHLRLGE